MIHTESESSPALEIIQQYYKTGSREYEILVGHSRLVAKKATEIAKNIDNLDVDLDLVYEAAMLHDIGIFQTHAPDLGCNGKYPYVCHGYLGRKLLEGLGMAKHALICERHVGVGFSAEEIKRLNFPMPVREMMPASLEEQIVCYADKFFSKNGNGGQEKPLDQIIRELMPYGMDKVERFKAWHERFNTE